MACRVSFQSGGALGGACGGPQGAFSKEKGAKNTQLPNQRPFRGILELPRPALGVLIRKLRGSWSLRLSICPLSAHRSRDHVWIPVAFCGSPGTKNGSSIVGTVPARSSFAHQPGGCVETPPAALWRKAVWLKPPSEILPPQLVTGSREGIQAEGRGAHSPDSGRSRATHLTTLLLTVAVIHLTTVARTLVK